MKIKRKIRFKEHTKLDKYTGLLFVSNKIYKKEKKQTQTQTPDIFPLKLNITKFFLENKNFCLHNEYVIQDNIKEYIKQKYNIESKLILNTNIIFKKDNKIIYLIYLDFNTNNKNNTISKSSKKIASLDNYTLINLYTIDGLKKYNDLYLSIYNKEKKLNISDYKFYYDNNNYITINLIDIYYYLIGNDYSNIDLKEHITI